MNRDRSARNVALAALPLGLVAAAAAAQTTDQAAAPVPPLPVVTPAPVPTPAAPVIVLPRATPTPAARPAPRATATPRPAPRPSATPTPRPRPAATPSPIPTPTPTPTPSPAATPTATPTPAPTPSPTVSASPAPAPIDPTATELAQTPDQVAPVENPKLWPAILLGLALAGGIGYLIWYALRTRRARRLADEEARRPQVLVAGSTAPPPSGPAPAGSDVPTFWTPSRPAELPPVIEELAAAEEPAPAPTRPRITYTLHPRRAGLNLVSATADVELTVRNEGDGEANDVTVTIRLLGGRAGQEEELGALFSAEPGRPATPPFALAPGEEKVVRTTAILPRAEIEPIPVGGRAMFVPVIAADVRYTRLDGGRGQTAAAYVIGAPRAGSDKLSPFWLDAQPRMRDEVEARPHGLSVES